MRRSLAIAFLAVTLAACVTDELGASEGALMQCTDVVVEGTYHTQAKCVPATPAPEPECGDGTCTAELESFFYCPVDCPDPGCGDGVCRDPESIATCPDDCDACDHDGVCDPGEEHDCEDDCRPGCGDGVCDPGDDDRCPDDCGCDRDGVCELGEDGRSCPDDCSPDCGDGVCDPDEIDDGPGDVPIDDLPIDPGDVVVYAHASVSRACPEDCPCDDDGVCDPGEDTTTCPGDCHCDDDGTCDPDEDNGSCPGDCPCNEDGVCDPGEDAASCPEDCPTCGDGVCGSGEVGSCPNDCGPCDEDGTCDPGESPDTCNDCNPECTVVQGNGTGDRDERGCPRTPGCADRATDGSLCLPACSAQCQRVYQRYNFWVTNYNVSRTMGNGEHQGILITGKKYYFDPRLAWNAQGAPRQPWRRANGNKWRYGDGALAPEQFSLRTMSPAGESDGRIPVSGSNAASEAYLCQQPVTLMNTQISNHGRTLARTFVNESTGGANYRQLIPMRLLASAGESADAAREATCRRLGQVNTCVAGVQNGYCDTQCGNCSYVIPEGGRGTAAPNGTFARPPIRLTERGQAVFYGRRGAQVRWNNTNYDSPFAYCVHPTSTFTQEGITTALGWATFTSRVATGWWGHNSNTDAAAELRHFELCEDTPSAERLVGVCNVCGTPRSVSGREQYPCLDRNNTAAAKWSPMDAFHNIDNANVGGGGPGPPTCRRGGFAVHGM